MKLKIGDRVRFLNETGGGYVKRFLDNQMVEVETKDGWAIPYLSSELLVIPEDSDKAPYRAESNPVVVKRERGGAAKITADNSNYKVLLLVVRDTVDDGGFSGVRWYVVNDSEFTLRFAFYQEDDGGVFVIENDELEPGQKMFLQELPLGELSRIKGFHIQGLLTNSDANVIPPLISRNVLYNTKKFSSEGAYTQNDYLHENAISFDVTFSASKRDKEEVVVKEIADSALNVKNEFKSGKKKEITKEIDLHVNQLVDSVIGMSNREIIRVQMETFERELTGAIKDGSKSIVFIHGIGNGTLKETLRKTLDKDYPICSHEDASFKDYGFGATLVRIRQNR